jgi:hypothetical protein
MTKNLANLIKVKTFVTFAIVAVYCYMAVTGKIQPDNVQTVAMMILAFYFGTQTEKKS